ncbi:response regulator [Thioclava sp. BHET1]|uniref:Histidine kinase n=1 Tax=Thioclava dalianensis TaxID=1185766 RepID=A0A074TIE6_9RHOB|nr:response regulator [Thioclava dalianensis]KEP71419.1 histidine kinase [Thioclava dalianensis]TMV92092.1 response regulator [Thioclava sp. BHET1]
MKTFEAGTCEQTCRILIAEDEAVVALDLQLMFEDLGARVIGPCATVRGALAEAQREMPTAAVLDVMLADGEVYELADLLYAAGVTILFHSGHADARELLQRYPEARLCPKPAIPSDLESKLDDIVRPQQPPGA